ncbi:MAG: M15 family metallopeptidase [Thermoleophilia bacterium]
MPIEPVDEPLVRIGGLHPRIADRAEYFRWGLPGSLPATWLRRGVAERLVAVADSLPQGIGLAVWDGYRPLQVQSALFDAYLTELTAVHPEMPADALLEAAARYVTPPSRSVLAPPPHLTGGAVDLTLMDADGELLDLGTAFDAFVPEAEAHALEDQPGPVRDRRRLLFWAMHEQGFTNYAEEWWHFDHGDQFWGLMRDRPAIYGAAEPPS